MEKAKSFVLWFDEISIEDLPLVGGKNSSLGEMYSALKAQKVNVPNGFAITSTAYRYLLEQSEGRIRLEKILKELNSKDPASLKETGKKARELISSLSFPEPLVEAITTAYHKLSKQYKTANVDVAVRSSATAEDLPNASFAGQQESFLHICSVHELLEACKRCFASLFTDRAIAYRENQGFDHFQVALSIGVQKMVRSDLASAGVCFTLDTETGFSQVVFITGSVGLGENVVQGTVNPDEFYVFKPTLDQGFASLIDKRLGDKATQIVYARKKRFPHTLKKIRTPQKKREAFCLNDEEVLQLAKWAILIEEHYSKKAKKWVPMDIEWAKDGVTGKLFIVQARPETVQSRRNSHMIEEDKLLEKGKVLVVGKSVGRKIAQGTAHVIESVKEIHKFKENEVLVTEMTDPDWVPIMRIASGIVTNRGGRTSHAAIVSRELGLPCIVGTNDATEVIESHSPITVSCAEGERGIVYEGLLKYKTSKLDSKKCPQTQTKVMLNIGYPDEAYGLSFLPSDGVGLARQEFIINEHIRIHPMALIHFDRVKERTECREIEKITTGYSDKKQFFVDKLAQGISIIAAAFYPRDVILRFSDFKTNEYAHLIGGRAFEPKEANPMIGWRGASRYYKSGYEEGFALECAAIKKAREEFGLINLKVMVPVCRTPAEGKKVLKVMRDHGLAQGKKGLEVYVMCEIPSNVILAEQFCDIFDGFSIGSNDLTQMTLGVDRDSELVADIYDERSEAVTRLIAEVIAVAKKHKTKIGICGDAPSTYPEFTKFLIDCGIDSISLSPDAFVRTRMQIANYEKGLGKQAKKAEKANQKTKKRDQKPKPSRQDH